MELETLRDYIMDDTFEAFEIYHLVSEKTERFESIDDLPSDLYITSFDCRNGKVMPIITFNVED